MWKKITVTDEYDRKHSYEIFVEDGYAFYSKKTDSNRQVMPAYFYKYVKAAGCMVKQDKVRLSTLRRGLATSRYIIF